MKRAAGVIAGMLVCLVAGCGGGLRNTPTEPGACQRLAGSYLSDFGNSCGKFGSGDAVTLTQSACTVTAAVPGVGTVTGTIAGETITLKVDFAGGCTGSGTGSATIDGTRITAKYVGSQTGTGCCSPMEGQFTLTAR